MFKVVTDQLKVSQGWVRCGQCAEVFEAPEHMQAAASPAAAVAVAVSAPQSIAPSVSPALPLSTRALAAGNAALRNPDAIASKADAADTTPHDVPESPVADAFIDSSWAPARTFADQHRLLPGRHLAPANGSATNSDFDPERWQQAHQARLLQQAQASDALSGTPPLASSLPSRSPAETPLPVVAPSSVRPSLLAADAPRPAPPTLRPLFPLADAASAPFPVAVPEARPYGFTKAKKSASPSTFDPFATPDPLDTWSSSPASALAQARQAPFEPHSELPELSDVHDVSFVRQAQRQAFWRRPVIRALSGLVALMLCAVLALQWGLQNRDALAARSPQWSAWVMAACVPLKCSVRAPRNIEQVVIDSSGFNQLAPDVYQLSVTLKNRSAVAVQIPALEVTLTDTADRPLLRRVVLPADFAPTTAMAPTLAAGGELQGVVHITLVAAPKGADTNPETPAPAGSWPVVGYRLLAFYPD